MVDHRRPARVLHTSDVHLAVPGGAEEVAFRAALDLAAELEVDAVLIAGDLFDHARVAEACSTTPPRRWPGSIGPSC